MGEPLPLATIHGGVLEFLQERDDAVLFGAQAVNAYVDEPRMTQEVDVVSPRARELAEELRTFLANRFSIAVRIREVRGGAVFRLYQLRKPANRHLVDIRHMAALPPHQQIQGVSVTTPEELISNKVLSMLNRRKTAKELTDLADIRRLLLALPELKAATGLVHDRLVAAGANESAFQAWKGLVAEEILPDDDADF